MEELTASVYYRDANGTETPLAGMAMSGALVPSASHLRSGTVTANISSLDNLAQVQVTFDSPMPDNNYMVNIEVTGWGGAGNLGTNISITQKSVNGFLIRQYVSAEVPTTSMTYKWTAFRLNTTEQIALDEGQIEQNKTDIATINSLIPSNATTNNKLATEGLLQGYSSNPYTDCNAIIKVGTYSITPLVSNRPSNCDYGVMMVFGNTTNKASSSSQWIYQYFYETAGRVYRRYVINPNTLTPSSSQWGAWELIAGGVEQISNPFTASTTTVTNASEIVAMKQSRVVQFKVYLDYLKNITTGSWITLGTVVDSIKPAMETVLTISDGSTVMKTALARITTNGEVQIWGNQELNSMSSRFSATYFSAS